MSDIKSISALMKELQAECKPCTRCGICQAHCPVFSRTGRETDTARGKVALLEGLMEDIITDAKGVYERLSKCLLCGSCTAKCPRGIKTAEIIIKARTILSEYMKLSPFKKLIFHKLVANPKMFDRMLSLGTKYQHLFLTPKDPISGTSCARFISPLISDRHIIPLAKVPFRYEIKTIPFKTQINSDKKRPIRVAFFVGCLIDRLFPEVAKASVYAMNHLQMEVIIPEMQGCCGIPVITSGDRKSFLDLVMYHLELFPPDKFDYLVTACATCTATIKLIWPMIFQSGHTYKIKQKIKLLADKTLDISQLVVNSAETKTFLQTPQNPIPLTYHAPCHLTKSLGIKNDPIQLISSNPLYRFTNMKDHDQCCGLGGSFSLKHYDISTDIGLVKRNNIIASGAMAVATGCPACMIQIADMIAKKKDNISIKHVIEIYAETIR